MMAQNNTFNLGLQLKEALQRNTDDLPKQADYRSRENILAEGLGFPIRWASGPSTPKDASEARRPTLKNKLFMRGNLNGTNFHDDQAPTSSNAQMYGIESPVGEKESWNSLKKRLTISSTLLSARAAAAASSLAPTPQSSAADESDSNDTDNATSEHNLESKSSPQTSHRGNDSTASKASSISYHDGYLTDTAAPAFSVARKKSATIGLTASPSEGVVKFSPDYSRFQYELPNWPQTNHMNFIIVLGLVLGIIVSKLLQFTLVYFHWFQKQVLQLRTVFLGECSLWEFFNLDHTGRYSLRTKLLIMPLVGTCSILYGLISLLHWTIRIMLAQTPVAITKFLHEYYSDF